MKIQQIKQPAHGLLLALVLGLLSPGCQLEHALMVSEAQDQLIQAAELENAKKFDQDSSLTSQVLDQAQMGYIAAQGLANQVLNDARGDLKRDRLLGTALMVRAVSNWRLGNLTEAENDAKAVAELDASEISPAEAALARALPFPMQIDALGVDARTLAGEADKPTAVEQWLARCESTDAGLTKALGDAEDGHPIRLYLIQSRLELVYVVLRGLSRLDGADQTTAQAVRYTKLRDAALAQARKASDGPAFAEEQANLEGMIGYYEMKLRDFAAPNGQ